MSETVKGYMAIFRLDRKNHHKQLAIAAISEDGKNIDPSSVYLLIRE